MAESSRQADGGAGYRPLSGPSPTQLDLRGTAIMGLTLLPLIGLGFESKLGSAEDAYAGSMLGLGAAFILGGLAVMLMGQRKRRLEIANGYTTIIPTAIEHPELYLLTNKKRELISRPGEPRPPYRQAFSRRVPAGGGRLRRPAPGSPSSTDPHSDTKPASGPRRLCQVRLSDVFHRGRNAAVRVLREPNSTCPRP